MRWLSVFSQPCHLIRYDEVIKVVTGILDYQRTEVKYRQTGLGRRILTIDKILTNQ